MSRTRFLCLGAGDGWHSNQLSQAAIRIGCEMHFATYESIQAKLLADRCQLQCDAGPVDEFDLILTRTMPAGSLEQITFRLAALHAIEQSPQFSIPIVNPPSSLEIAIDKFATLQRVSQLGYPVPDTIVIQSRREALDAFQKLGGDCIVKPIFGGEGRGVMRIRDAELAWTTFSTLENLGAICYVQRFVQPGGSDTRLLVIGDWVLGIRRYNDSDFRTNVSSGGDSRAIELTADQTRMAKHICDSIGLRFASVDLLDRDDGDPQVIEVNAIPGWKGAQGVTDVCIAEKIVQLLCDEVTAIQGATCQ